ncbi:uncharacterized protein [Ranitomeya imitator]|uniref:uncharacterized protein n=2 Tax=Ranitomeya imitator TaxID=111125 RepID=UPI0037E75A6B
MSSSGSPPPQQQQVSESESDEELSEGTETGGDIEVEEEPSSPAAAAAAAAAGAAERPAQHEGSPRRSQSRRTRRRGRPSASQCAPEYDSDIDIEALIEEVREREPLWNMADRRHADTSVTHRLWLEVCRNIFARWEDLLPQQQSKLCTKVRKRWRSLRDRFKREFNEEMQAPSGSAARKKRRYRYGPNLSFLRETMLSRVTYSSHRAPASTSAPSEAIPPESATGDHVGRPHTSHPSVPSTSSASTSGVQPSLLASDGQQIAFPLPHPSDPATSTPPVGSWRQRQRGQERSYAPEFLHLNAGFQNSFKILGEQVTAGFSMMQSRMSENHHEISSRLDRLHLDVSQAPANLFFQSMLRSMEKLSFDQQMRVMNSCHNALLKVINEPQSTPTPPHTSQSQFQHHAPQYHRQSQYPHHSQYQHHYQYPTRPTTQMYSPVFSSSLPSFTSPVSFPPTPTQHPSGQPPVFPPPSTTDATGRVSPIPPTDVVQPSSPSSHSYSTQQYQDL